MENISLLDWLKLHVPITISASPCPSNSIQCLHVVCSLVRYVHIERTAVRWMWNLETKDMDLSGSFVSGASQTDQIIWIVLIVHRPTGLCITIANIAKPSRRSDPSFDSSPRSLQFLFEISWKDVYHWLLRSSTLFDRVWTPRMVSGTYENSVPLSFSRRKHVGSGSFQ